MSLNTGKDKKRVVIVGAGFGGVKVAKLLDGSNLDVTIVDRNNFHLFQPLLYQLSTSEIDENEIAYPVRAFFRNSSNVNFLMATAEDVDKENKILKTSEGDVPFDYLVLAAGATTNFFGMKSIADNAFGMKTLQEAIKIRNHVLRMFEQASTCTDEAERRKMLTFVCVGGGPTGVEVAGALSELIYGVIKNEYHNLNVSEAKIVLVEAIDRLLSMMPPDLSEETARVLREKRNVDVRLNTACKDYDGEMLTFKEGEPLPTRTVIWSAGVKAVSLMTKLGVETDRSGRVKVNHSLQLEKYPEIFAIGDCACYIENEGERPLPTVAPVATQQAVVCADNIKRLASGSNVLTQFKYKDLGSMATICRGNAVASMGNMKMKGFFAWVAWMFVHLLRLEGGYTNITVLYKWFWNFLFGLRLGRVITDTKIKD